MLPLALFCYFTLNHFQIHKAATVSLLSFSLVFYLFSGYKHLIYLLVSILFNYVLSKKIGKQTDSDKRRKIYLGIAISINVLLLAITKYSNSVIHISNKLFEHTFAAIDIIIPLGISFITFLQIAYLVDSYKGETSEYSFFDYALFVSYFPKIISGPIVRHEQLLPQLQDKNIKRFNYENFASGIHVFSVGLVKKVILAELLASPVSWGFNTSNIDKLSSPEAWIVILAYTFQIYFDFSGYTDMARGISKMFNLELVINFNSPYKANSIQDFWKRWHISLTDFLRRYIYFPLGGNRKGQFRTYANIIIIYLISGLWHGSSMTFVCWGALPGFATILNRRFSSQRDKLNHFVQCGITFIFVNLSWVVFRAANLRSALSFYRRLFTFSKLSISKELTRSFFNLEIRAVEHILEILLGSGHITTMQVIPMFLVLTICMLIVFTQKNLQEIKQKTTLVRALSTVFFLVWGILSLSGITSYIYAGF